jgi:hypothetical protein
MAEAFDPYRKWLGIPAQDQPPHYYRLLGLELFEPDADVISNAVDGRMTQIKTFQAGKYSAFSQKILNEIAAARVCLLNPAKKAEYDRQLRAQGVGAAPAEPAAAVVAPPPAPAGFDEPPRIAETDFASLQSDLYVSYRKPKSKAWIIPVALSVVFAIVGVVVVMMLKKDAHVFDEPVAEAPAVEKTIAKKEPSKTEKKTEKEQPSKKNNLPPGAKIIKNDVVEKKVEAKKPQVTSTGTSTSATVLLASAATPKKKVEDPDSLKAMNDEESESKKAADKKKDEEKTSEKADEEDADKDKAAEEKKAEKKAAEKADKKPKKPPVPSEAEQQAAEKKIREIFGKDLNAKDPAQKRDNLQKFTAQGEDAANDAATRYVFLRMARDLAVSMAESAEAMTIVESMAKAFDLGPDASEKSLKLESLAKVLESHRYKPSSPEKIQEFFAAVKNIMDDALLEDDYDASLRACKLGARAAARDPQTLHEFTAKQADINQAKAKFSAIRRALDALKDDPENGAANQVVGRWLCLLKEDWTHGLSKLAKSDNATLADLAKKELKKPSKPKEQLSLADGWWDAAEKEQSSGAKHALQTHAGQWYRKALPGLAGLDHTKAERRLNDVAGASDAGDAAEDVAPASPVSRRSVVQKGNVALASNGTKVTSKGKINNADCLLDGNVAKYDGGSGSAISEWPCEWTITFAKVYQLRELRLLFWDLDKQRFYGYAIAVSSDGKKFTPLIDRSKGEWRGWQKVDFSARPVKAIKLYGLHNSANRDFHVVEFEAYCIPPTTPLPQNK